MFFLVIPAQAGIQFLFLLDSRLRGNDGYFVRSRLCGNDGLFWIPACAAARAGE